MQKCVVLINTKLKISRVKIKNIIKLGITDMIQENLEVLHIVYVIKV